ncbi:MAG TPA: TatD family hydrolase [Bacteroidia bacterium]|nr:TatD family hydrolase [Bacteroidia bacterium]
MIFTDTHTHLYAKEFDIDRNQLIENAIQKGVQRFFLPNIDSTFITDLLQLKNNFPENCFPMIGLHPCSVNENYVQELAIAANYLSKEKFIAIGEIGIDLYWDKTFFSQQQFAFRTQIEWAKKWNLPIVIHSRNSFDEVYEILSETNDNKLKGIFHCFSGNVEQAKKIIALGNFKLGIGGVLTFKNSGLDNVVKEIDLEHLVLETDAPYLAPTPHRGKRNEPSYLVLIAEKLAAIKNCSVEEIAEITTQNSKIIFGI